jgi:hypothetical protein
MASKTCEACWETFTTEDPDQRTCGNACGGTLRRGRRYGGANKRHVRSGAVGDHEPCPCSRCEAIRTSDRTALVARVAAEMHVEVTDPLRPRKKLSWEARYKAIREGKRVRDAQPAPRDTT